MIDPADHIVAYKTAEGALINAKTGAPVSGAEPAAFKKVRVNNALRNAIQGAMGSLTLASSDPEKRLKAAQDLFNTRDAKALPALRGATRQGERLARRRRAEARPGRDLRHQRQRLNPGSPLGDSNAEGARRSGRAESHRLDRPEGDRSSGQKRRSIRLERHPGSPRFVGRRAEPLVWRLGVVRSASGGNRACDHLRRHGRHQYGAWRNGDARRLFDLYRADASAAVLAGMVACARHSTRLRGLGGGRHRD